MAKVQGSFPPWFTSFIGWATVFFALNLVPFTAAFFVMGHDTFVWFSLLYLGEISILAMVAGCGSWWQAARIESAQAADADVQQVVDILDDAGLTEGNSNGADPGGA